MGSVVFKSFYLDVKCIDIILVRIEGDCVYDILKGN